MKGLLIAFAVFAVAASECIHSDGNGQPGCRTLAELETRNFRNNWDPTVYWVCEELNVAATSAQCGQSEGFQTAANGCVSFAEWVYDAPCEPPSQPEL